MSLSEVHGTLFLLKFIVLSWCNEYFDPIIESGSDSSLTTPPSVDETYQHSENASTKELDWDGPNDPGNPRNWSNRRRLDRYIGCQSFYIHKVCIPTSKRTVIPMDSVI